MIKDPLSPSLSCSSCAVNFSVSLSSTCPSITSFSVTFTTVTFSWASMLSTKSSCSKNGSLVSNNNGCLCPSSS
uniref:Uncharacterized protein MANES_15G061300 n=1 Tax=Rhizophora mucronata TaxID=61149 RepID=A0A2P2IZE4_RHIMU